MILLVIMLRMMEVVILKWWRFSNKINLKPKHKQVYQVSFMLFGHVWYIVDGRLCNTLMLQSFPPRDMSDIVRGEGLIAWDREKIFVFTLFK